MRYEKTKVKRNSWSRWYFFVPSIVGVCIFSIIPFLDVIRRSFLVGGVKGWVGVKNYQMVITNSAFNLAVINTIKFLIICLPILICMSLIVAVALKDVTRSIAIKTMLLLPLATPLATAAVVWQITFHNFGLVNGALDILGIQTRNWMNSSLAFYILVITYVWKNLGYSVVLWLAGLNAISKDIYEAAHMDGAGRFLCFWKITIPNLKSTCFMIIVLSLINSFKIFREAYLVAGDYPHESMYMLQHLFNNWFRDLSIDKLAAGAVLETVVIITLIYIIRKIWKEG